MPPVPAPLPLGRILPRYLLFQVPGWCIAITAAVAAVEWWGLAPRWAALGLALWLAKDVALFPIVRRAYEPDGVQPHGPIGETGVAEDALDGDREAWIRVGPERWRARRAPHAGPIRAGDAVRIVGVRGLVLLVEPAGA